MVFILFFPSYVSCWICAITFGTFKSSSFIGLSRIFQTVIDVIIFDKCNSVLRSGKSHSLSNSSRFSSGLRVGSYQFVLPK